MNGRRHRCEVGPLFGVGAPLGGGAEVVHLEFECLDRCAVLGSEQPRRAPLGQPEEPFRMASTDEVRLCGVGEAVVPELSQRLQEPIAIRARLVDHQRPVDQPDDTTHGIDITVADDRLGGSEVERAGEHRQPPEHHTLVVVEQIVGPRHRRQQRPMSFLGPTRPTRQQPEPLIETTCDLRRRHRTNPRGGELDRQRDPIQATTDLHHRRNVPLVDTEPLGRCRCAVREQPDRRSRPGVRQRPIRVGQQQRRNPPHLLAIEAERLTTRCDHVHVRCAHQDRVDQVRRPRRARAHSCPTRSASDVRPGSPPTRQR